MQALIHDLSQRASAPPGRDGGDAPVRGHRTARRRGLWLTLTAVTLALGSALVFMVGRDGSGVPLSAEEQAEVCLASFESGQYVEKTKALEVLAGLPKGVVEPLLGDALTSSPDEALPWLAQGCARLKATGLAQALIHRMQASVEIADESVYQALGMLGAAECRAFALEQLKSKDARLRKRGWHCLAQCASETDLDYIFMQIEASDALDQNGARLALSELYRKHPAWSQRLCDRFQDALNAGGVKGKRYSQVLAQLPPEAFVDLLTRLATDQDQKLRILGVRGLSQSERTISAVVPRLQDERDPEVLTECFRGLIRFPRHDGIAGLLAHMNAAPSVRKRAHQALVAAFGLDKGPEEPAWREWISEGDREGDPSRRKVFERQRQHRMQGK